MNREEVINRLTANVDKVVRVSFNDGKAETIKVHLVDDEGIVYFLVLSDQVDDKAYWTVFGDIKSVSPSGDSK